MARMKLTIELVVENRLQPHAVVWCAGGCYRCWVAPSIPLAPRRRFTGPNTFLMPQLVYIRSTYDEMRGCFGPTAPTLSGSTHCGGRSGPHVPRILSFIEKLPGGSANARGYREYN